MSLTSQRASTYAHHQHADGRLPYTLNDKQRALAQDDDRDAWLRATYGQDGLALAAWGHELRGALARTGPTATHEYPRERYESAVAAVLAEHRRIEALPAWPSGASYHTGQEREDRLSAAWYGALHADA